MKLVLTPIKPYKGYTPQDAIIDFTNHREFYASQTEQFYKITDVEALIASGYTGLVFNCGGASQTITLTHEGKRTTMVRDGFQPAFLYFTEDVTKELRSRQRGYAPNPLFKPEDNPATCYEIHPADYAAAQQENILDAFASVLLDHRED